MLPPPNSARVYELTASCRELSPWPLALGRWGSVTPPPSPDAELGVDAGSRSRSAGTLFDPHAAARLDVTVELRLDDQPFRARVAGGELDVRRGSAERPDAVITADPPSLAAVLWHGPAPARSRSPETAGPASGSCKLFPLPAGA